MLLRIKCTFYNDDIILTVEILKDYSFRAVSIQSDNFKAKGLRKIYVKSNIRRKQHGNTKHE